MEGLYPYDSRFPVTDNPVPKAGFIPSKWEAKKVIELVRKIRAGHYDHKVRRACFPSNISTIGTVRVCRLRSVRMCSTCGRTIPTRPN